MTAKQSHSPAVRRHHRQSVTIHDVAARAGVSVATVSRVLNHKQLVREDTSREVLEAARLLRYVPNVAARALSIRRSQTIGIVLPDVHGEFFSEIIRGIDLAARREGYHILVSGSHSDAGEMLEVLEAMRGRVDGLLVMAPDVSLTGFRKHLPPDLPLVMLNSARRGEDAITVDNFSGARMMMRHLTGLGHSRIAFIKGPGHNVDARERLRGYRQSMRSLKAGPRELEVDGDFTERSGYAATQHLLAGRLRATAIFAANDSMAIGTLSALADSGVAVPGDMTVVGFDDIPIAQYVNPPLTTMRVDIAEMGRCAFALLLNAIANPTAHTSRHDRAATALVVRRSCAAAKTVKSKRVIEQPHRAARGRKRGEKGEVS